MARRNTAFLGLLIVLSLTVAGCSTALAPVPAEPPAQTGPNSSPGLTPVVPGPGPVLPGDGANGSTAVSPNILFITIDALNATHINSYGSPRVKTPVMDGLAAAGVRFSMHINTFYQTSPSIASMFTSTYPAVHKVRTPGLDRLGDSLPTLAGLLADRGYETAAVYGSRMLDPETSGLDRGFRAYRPAYFSAPGQQDRWRQFDSSADVVTDAAIAWLKERTPGPFFLWVHYQDPHYPFTPPPPFDTMYGSCDDCADGSYRTVDRINAGARLSERDIANIRALYDGEVSFTDQELGRLMAAMSDAGALGNTMVVLTADEGQSLSDNGHWFHPYVMYNSVIRAPLIISYPPVVPAGTAVNGVTRGIDIMPTILQTVGAPTPSQAQGSSLWPLITGKEASDQRTAFTQGLNDQHVAIISGHLKLIRNNRTGSVELYDLESDPGELANLSLVRAEKAAELDRRVKDWMDSQGIAYR